MARTKGAKNKKNLPDSLALINKSLKEMQSSINFLASVREGKKDGFDNKDRVSASKTLVDLGKYFYTLADTKGLFTEDDIAEMEEQKNQEQKKQTGSVFQLKGFKQ